jgi:hypothetical protein
MLRTSRNLVTCACLHINWKFEFDLRTVALLTFFTYIYNRKLGNPLSQCQLHSRVFLHNHRSAAARSSHIISRVSLFVVAPRRRRRSSCQHQLVFEFVMGEPKSSRVLTSQGAFTFPKPKYWTYEEDRFFQKFLTFTSKPWKVIGPSVCHKHSQGPLAFALNNKSPFLSKMFINKYIFRVLGFL